jgi:hypothetical protein
LNPAPPLLDRQRATAERCRQIPLPIDIESGDHVYNRVAMD